MTRFRLFLSLFFLANSLIINAQFDKANDLYQAKQYAAAIPFFEKGLLEKENLAARTRLANCYRLTNKMDKAEELFAKIVEQPRAKSETFLHYAEALMSNGKYAEAKQFFLKYAALEPDDSLGQRMARNCDLVPEIKPYFSWVSVEELPFNDEAADDNSALFWRGGIVFTSDRASGPAFLKKKAGWTGRDYLKLWWTRYDADGHFSEPKSLSGRLNELNKNTANASFTADGEHIFFTRNADFTGNDYTLNLQLFSAESTSAGGRWAHEERLSFCTPEVNYMHPAIAPDGSWLVFSSNKNGSLGGFDLWFSRKTATGKWSRPENMGPQINTSQHEGFPFIASDGRLFFCSKGHVGFGGFDIFVSKFDSTKSEWAKPTNLGRPINGSHDDLSFSLAANDSVGLFTSSRNGDEDDIYLFWLGGKRQLPKVAEAEVVAVEKAVSEAQVVENQGVEIFSGPLPLDSLSRFLSENRSVEGAIFSLKNVRFDSTTALEPRDEATLDLEKIRVALASFPFLKIEIEAHSEPFEKEKTAQKLTQKRADFLKQKLLNAGAPEAQILAKGFGAKEPIFLCPLLGDCPPEKLLANRRVEIKVVH